MALWEYKVITSGKGGFASATMLESYLNQLGKDEWEIIDFRADPNNTLAFNGLARRPTQREWTLEAAVAAAAKAEADKLRAELMHKQHAGDAGASADSAGQTAGEKAAGPDGLRQLRDTDRDHDPEALADEASHGTDDWANLDTYEDDLPTFFDAIKPHLRKNQNTPGQSVALNYLAKRWEQPEPDLHGALKECGFVIPENETDAPAYLEFEGDLYWVEKNNRGQFFLNTREKPRPKFRVAQGKPLDPADPAYAALAEEQAAAEAERAKRAAELAAREAEALAKRAEREAQRQAAEQARREQQAAAQAAREAARAAAAAASAPPVSETGEIAPAAEVTAPAEAPASSEPAGGGAPAPKDPAPASNGGVLPLGEALLDAIRPQMRRNRRGPGYSGSSAYLAKFFKVDEAALKAALTELGLAPAEGQGGKGEAKVIGAYAYWVNKDGSGGWWINGREAGPRERAGAAKPAAGGAESSAAPAEAAPEPAAGEAPSPGAEMGEPPIFRAVPRAMPPIPAASLAESEAAGSLLASEQSTAEATSASAPAAEAVSEAPAAAPAVPPAEAAPVPAPAAEPVSEPASGPKPEEFKLEEPKPEGAKSEPETKPARKGGGRKPRAKAGEPEAVPAEAGAEGETEKPAKASSSRPRTKRRSSAAIEADSAAEE